MPMPKKGDVYFNVKRQKMYPVLKVRKGGEVCLQNSLVKIKAVFWTTEQVLAKSEYLLYHEQEKNEIQLMLDVLRNKEK